MKPCREDIQYDPGGNLFLFWLYFRFHVISVSERRVYQEKGGVAHQQYECIGINHRTLKRQVYYKIVGGPYVHG